MELFRKPTYKLAHPPEFYNDKWGNGLPLNDDGKRIAKRIIAALKGQSTMTLNELENVIKEPKHEIREILRFLVQKEDVVKSLPGKGRR